MPCPHCSRLLPTLSLAVPSSPRRHTLSRLFPGISLPGPSPCLPCAFPNRFRGLGGSRAGTSGLMAEGLCLRYKLNENLATSDDKSSFCPAVQRFGDLGVALLGGPGSGSLRSSQVCCQQGCSPEGLPGAGGAGLGSEHALRCCWREGSAAQWLRCSQEACFPVPGASSHSLSFTNTLAQLPKVASHQKSEHHSARQGNAETQPPRVESVHSVW